MMGRWGELDTPGHLEVDMGPPSGQVVAGRLDRDPVRHRPRHRLDPGVPVMGKGQARIVAALERIQPRLPSHRPRLHAGNGS